MENIIVIGGGYGGLTTALKLANEGHSVTLLEKHNKLGGLAQAWTRKPRLSNGDRVAATFELTHAVSGFHSGGIMHKLYTDLGINWDNVGDYVAAEKFAALRTPDGDKTEVLNDIGSMKTYLLQRFPDERKGIHKFFNLLDRIDQERLTENRRPGWQKSLEEFVEPRIDNPLLKIPMYILTKPTLVMRRNHTFQRYLDDCFKGEDIKAGLSTLFGYVGLPSSRVSGTLMNCMLLSYWGDGGPQAPEFNSFQALPNEIARTLVDRFNGKVYLNSEVEKIHVSNGKVRGIRVKGRRGQEDMELKADYVVIGGDMKKGMLPLRKHLPRSYVNRLEGMEMSLSLMNVHAIVEMDLMKMKDEISYAANVLVSSKGAIETANGENFPDEFALYVSVPTVLRPDANLVRNLDGSRNDRYHIVDIVMQSPPYERWAGLRSSDMKAYRQEKERYEKEMLRIVDENFIPGLADSVRFMHGYTAVTHERYCDCTEGAVYTFAPTPKQFIPNRFPPRTPIKGLYLTGSTVTSAGVRGAISGAELTSGIMLKDMK